ncbi:MAG: peptide chain release factor-like protein [Candidatus Omnitrophota bacterium]
MNPFGVSEEKYLTQLKKMARLKVLERDLEESFIRSSGPGGQNVNKVATCVVLRHQPTGIVVKCQQERQQALNRFLARRLLLNEIERRQADLILKEMNQREKIRRQKRKRSKNSKEEILKRKHIHGQKKKDRQPLSLHRFKE